MDEKVKQIYDTEMARIAEETSELINMDSAHPEFNMSFYRAYRFVSKPFTAERLINAPSKKISAATYTKLAREQKLPEMNRYCSVAAPCMLIFKCNFKETSKDFSLFYKQFPIGL